MKNAYGPFSKAHPHSVLFPFLLAKLSLSAFQLSGPMSLGFISNTLHYFVSGCLISFLPYPVWLTVQKALKIGLGQIPNNARSQQPNSFIHHTPVKLHVILTLLFTIISQL